MSSWFQSDSQRHLSFHHQYLCHYLYKWKKKACYWCYDFKTYLLSQQGEGVGCWRKKLHKIMLHTGFFSRKMDSTENLGFRRTQCMCNNFQKTKETIDWEESLSSVFSTKKPLCNTDVNHKHEKFLGIQRSFANSRLCTHFLPIFWKHLEIVRISLFFILHNDQKRNFLWCYN